MSESRKTESPEVYALLKAGENWQISRREFLKAAGLGAAAACIGLNSRFVRPVFAETDPAELCKEAPAHGANITDMMLSPDGSYLLIIDAEKTCKCWNFGTYELLSKKDDLEFTDETVMTVGTAAGKPCLIFTRGSEQIHFRELPDLDASAEQTITLTGKDPKTIKALASDSNGSIYVLKDGARDNVIRLEPGDGTYTRQTVVYSSENLAANIPVKVFGFMENDRKILVKLYFGNLAVLDLTSGKMETMGTINSEDASVLPDDLSALAISDDEKGTYRLVSLGDGVPLWEQTRNALDGNLFPVGCAVSPDGSAGVLLCRYMDVSICLIDMTDGTLIRRMELNRRGNCARIVVSPDGSKCAAAVENSILFVSLPALAVIGCPVDLDNLKDSKEGSTVVIVDMETGKTATITQPCGAEIPPYSVCTCNCVKGNICSCVGYKSNPCDCNSYHPHYWHPN